jgi:hypothetical protein
VTCKIIVSIGFQTDSHRSNSGHRVQRSVCPEDPSTADKSGARVLISPGLIRTWGGREHEHMNVRIKLGVVAASGRRTGA